MTSEPTPAARRAERYMGALEELIGVMEDMATARGEMQFTPEDVVTARLMVTFALAESYEAANLNLFNAVPPELGLHPERAAKVARLLWLFSVMGAHVLHLPGAAPEEPKP